MRSSPDATIMSLPSGGWHRSLSPDSPSVGIVRPLGVVEVRSSVEIRSQQTKSHQTSEVVCQWHLGAIALSSSEPVSRIAKKLPVLRVMVVENERLRAQRRLRGWSQEDVARGLVGVGIEIDEKQLGVTRHLVSRWERG